MKYFFLMTSSSNVINFRLPLIKKIISSGDQVVVVANDSLRKKEIEEVGAVFFIAENNNRSINPFAALRYKKSIQKLIKKCSPDIVFTFQSKPNIFGSIAAKKCGIDNIFCMIEGLGAPFTYGTIKWKLIRFIESLLYKKALKHANKVFFLNEEDSGLFLRKRIVNSNQTMIINGIGVDLNYFSHSPIKNNPSPTFLMIARMLEAKGILDYCKCAEIVKKEYPNVRFKYLGAEAELTLSDIKYYIENGYIEYAGNVADVRPFIRESLMVVLPSFYREGKPMSIMEAQAIGRSVITTDNVGCKDTIQDKFNGFVIEKNNVEQLVERCVYSINHFEEIKQMGLNARQFAEDNFDCEIINGIIIDTIKGSLKNNG